MGYVDGIQSDRVKNDELGKPCKKCTNQIIYAIAVASFVLMYLLQKFCPADEDRGVPLENVLPVFGPSHKCCMHYIADNDPVNKRDSRSRLPSVSPTIYLDRIQ